LISTPSLAQDQLSRKSAYHWSENLAVTQPETGKQRAETEIATDKNGLVWLSYLDADYKHMPTGMWIAWPRRLALLTSSDGGRSFTNRRTLSDMGGNAAFAVSPTGEIYASWVQYSYDEHRTLQQQIVVQRLGLEAPGFSAPTSCPSLSAGAKHDQSNLFIAGDGSVHIIGINIAPRVNGERRLLYARSNDTLQFCDSQQQLESVGQLPQVAATTNHLFVIGPTGYLASTDNGRSFATRVQHRFGDKLVRIAVSPDHRIIYVVGDATDGGLWIQVSDDNGNTWRKSRVDDAPHSSAWRYPAITVSAAGRVHILWMDDRTGSGALYHAYSDDQGHSFSDNVRVSDHSFYFPADAPPPPPATQSGTWIGDYLSATTLNNSVIAAWSDQRQGVPQSAIFVSVGIP
jgi:hypothetical protein